MEEKSLLTGYNMKGKFAEDIFNETHQKLLNSGREWLVKISESCSLLASLITIVAFAAATTVPGGNGNNGIPPLEREIGFLIFAISSLIALCLSTTSVVAFLSILSSRFEIEDFAWKLPLRLLIGLSSLFFYCGHVGFVLCRSLFYSQSSSSKYGACSLHCSFSLPIALFFAMVQMHLYYNLVVAIFSKVPT